MFVAVLDKKPKLVKVKLAGYFWMVGMCCDDDRTFSEVDDVDEDLTEGQDDDTVRFALSAETKPKLRSRHSFRDLEVSKKVLNTPSDAALTDGELEILHACSEITEEDVSNALAYW